MFKVEKSLNLLKLNNENYYFEEDQMGFRCRKCGGAFQKLILANVSSGDNVQTYYACPHCLTKMNKMKEQKSKESKKASMSTEGSNKVAEKFEKRRV